MSQDLDDFENDENDDFEEEDQDIDQGDEEEEDVDEEEVEGEGTGEEKKDTGPEFLENILSKISTSVVRASKKSYEEQDQDTDSDIEDQDDGEEYVLEKPIIDMSNARSSLISNAYLQSVNEKEKRRLEEELIQKRLEENVRQYRNDIVQQVLRYTRQVFTEQIQRFPRLTYAIQRSTIDTILESYKIDPECNIEITLPDGRILTPLQLLDEKFHIEGEPKIFDHIIKHSLSETDRQTHSIHSKCIESFMIETQNNLFDTKVGLLYHLMIHGKEKEEYTIEKEYDNLFFTWRSFELIIKQLHKRIDILTSIKMIKNRQEFQMITSMISSELETNQSFAEIDSFITNLLREIEGNQYTFDTKKDPQFQEILTKLYEEMRDKCNEYMFEHDYCSVVGLLDYFFNKKLVDKIDSIREKSKEDRITIINHEYKWLELCNQATFIHTRQRYHNIIQPTILQLQVDYTSRKLRQSIPKASRINFIFTEMILPRPNTNLVTRIEIESFFNMITNPSYIIRKQIDRNHSSDTFGNIIEKQVDLEIESINESVFPDYIPLLQCIPVLCRKMTIMDMKENVNHMITQDKIESRFMKYYQDATVLFKQMLVNIENMTEKKYHSMIQDTITYEKQLCIATFSSQLIDSKERSILFLNGIVRRVNRKSRIDSVKKIPIGKLDYQCRIKTQDILVRPIDMNQMVQFIIREHPIIADDRDVFYYPNTLLREQLCSTNVIITRNHIEVEGKRMYLGHLVIDPVTHMKTVVEFTSSEYVSFLQKESISIQSSLDSTNIYISRIKEQIEVDLEKCIKHITSKDDEKDDKPIDYKNKINELLQIVSGPYYTIHDILYLFYCFIILFNPTFQIKLDPITLQTIYNRYSNPDTIRTILQSSTQETIVQAFYRIIFRMNPHTDQDNSKQIIQYVEAYITKHIATTFEFLKLEHPSFSELYLSTLIPIQFIIMNYNNDIPTPPVLVEGRYGVSKKVVKECRYCGTKTDQFKTLGFRKKGPVPQTICGVCMNNISV
jgi:hypothetical protein